MNLRKRLRKVEEALNVNDDECRCPDAIALMGTPFYEVCCRCDKPLNIESWKHWHLIHPSLEMACFGFAMRRDDKQELAGKPDEYFHSEIRRMLEI